MATDKAFEDWLAHLRLQSATHDLYEALQSAVIVADEAREEWDKAPSGMRAGKLLIALSGHLKGYRPDIDAIHAVLAKVLPQPGCASDRTASNIDPSQAKPTEES